MLFAAVLILACMVLLLNVYMPDDASVQEFMNQLSLIEALLAGFDGDHVVVAVVKVVL